MTQRSIPSLPSAALVVGLSLAFVWFESDVPRSPLALGVLCLLAVAVVVVISEFLLVPKRRSTVEFRRIGMRRVGAVVAAIAVAISPLWSPWPTVARLAVSRSPLLRIDGSARTDRLEAGRRVAVDAWAGLYRVRNVELHGGLTLFHIGDAGVLDVEEVGVAHLRNGKFPAEAADIRFQPLLEGWALWSRPR